VDRRSVLKMTTAVGAGGAALHAASLLAAERNAAARKARDSLTDSPIAQLPRSSFIHRKDGTALFYKDWGTGMPVLFVHSAGLNCEMWTYQMVPFTARGTRCVAFDRRGHGKSSDPSRGYDFDTLADDLAAVLETLDLRNVALVGHSMGCAEITRYLTRHGSRRVGSVVMLAPTTPFLLKTADNPQGVDKGVFESVRAKWLKDYPKWLADNTDPFFVPETSPEMKHWGMHMAFSTSLQAAIQCNIAVAETDFRDELTRIDVPVLILHGTKDVSAPLALTGERTAQLIPRSVLRVYEGAPHGLFLTHMDKVNEDIARFHSGLNRG
jgi:non-heme chloroperoxidase